jgi:hypothetical protein
MELSERVLIIERHIRPMESRSHLITLPEQKEIVAAASLDSRLSFPDRSKFLGYWYKTVSIYAKANGIQLGPRYLSPENDKMRFFTFWKGFRFLSGFAGKDIPWGMQNAGMASWGQADYAVAHADEILGEIEGFYASMNQSGF